MFLPLARTMPLSTKPQAAEKALSLVSIWDCVVQRAQVGISVMLHILSKACGESGGVLGFQKGLISQT